MAAAISSDDISSISSLRYLNKPYVAYYTTKAALKTAVEAAKANPALVADTILARTG